MLALDAPQFAEAGRPAGDPLSNGDKVTIKANDTGKGNSAAYLAARLKKAARDDLLTEIGPGKRFKSVRAAAIEAGIIPTAPARPLINGVRIDPLLMEDGPASLAEGLRNATGGPDADVDGARYCLAHAAALQLPPTARAALSAAMTRLQALQTAAAALEAAGEALARELEGVPGCT